MGKADDLARFQNILHKMHEHECQDAWGRAAFCRCNLTAAPIVQSLSIKLCSCSRLAEAVRMPVSLLDSLRGRAYCQSSDLHCPQSGDLCREHGCDHIALMFGFCLRLLHARDMIETFCTLTQTYM